PPVYYGLIHFRDSLAELDEDAAHQLLEAYRVKLPEVKFSMTSKWGKEPLLISTKNSLSREWPIVFTTVRVQAAAQESESEYEFRAQVCEGDVKFGDDASIHLGFKRPEPSTS